MRAEKELLASFSDLGGAVESLASMGTFISLEIARGLTSTYFIETQVQDTLTKFGQESQTHVSLLREKITSQDLDYISPLHNYVTYCGAVKEALRLRDQKQVHFLFYN